MREAALEQTDDVGLTARLRRDLGDTGTGAEQLWNVCLVQALLEQSVQGKGRSMSEVWSRIEGRPGAIEKEPPVQLDDATARRIMEALRDDDDDPPDD
jgi:hypothetical protein